MDFNQDPKVYIWTLIISVFLVGVVVGIFVSYIYLIQAILPFQKRAILENVNKTLCRETQVYQLPLNLSEANK